MDSSSRGTGNIDYLLVWRLPLFHCMMKRVRLCPDTSPLLAERLASSGSTSYSPFVNLLPEPTLSVPTMPLVRSLTCHSPLSRQEINFDTFSQGVDKCPTPTLSEPTIAFDVTPSDIGPQTMTDVIEQFMEDLHTQEFYPITLDEDI